MDTVPIKGSKMEILQWVPNNSQHENIVRIIYGDMENVIEQFKNNPQIAFSHCISGDFGSGGQMSKGVALAFRKQFGRPTRYDRVSQHLTFQRARNEGAGIYSLITKPKFFHKPRLHVYDQAFEELVDEINRNGYRHLICSPMGCVRDRIRLDHFITKIFYLQEKTGVSVSIVTFNEQVRRILWNGVTYKDFLKEMRTLIDSQYQKI